MSINGRKEKGHELYMYENIYLVVKKVESCYWLEMNEIWDYHIKWNKIQLDTFSLIYASNILCRYMKPYLYDMKAEKRIG